MRLASELFHVSSWIRAGKYSTDQLERKKDRTRKFLGSIFFSVGEFRL
jgi:hypothetical protein